MEYKVVITPNALTHLHSAVKYISDILLAPETAAKWLDVLEREISSLREIPARFPLAEKEPWRSRGIRKLPVKGFIVYYTVIEERNTVAVTAVIYGRRDQISALKDIDE